MIRSISIYFKKSPGFEAIKELDLQAELLSFFKAKGYEAKVIENGFESKSEKFDEEEAFNKKFNNALQQVEVLKQSSKHLKEINEKV